MPAEIFDWHFSLNHGNTSIRSVTDQPSVDGSGKQLLSTVKCTAP